MSQLTDSEKEIYGYVASYRDDDEVINGVFGITYTFDRVLADVSIGNIEEDKEDLCNMYEAYRVLCAMAGVVPLTYSAIYTGNHFGSHNGEFPKEVHNE